MTTHFKHIVCSTWRTFVHRWRRPGPHQKVEATFHNDHYLRLTARTLEHLASLNLPLHGRTVLEVGAGAGDYSSFFIDRACRVTITDVRPELLAYLHHRFPGQEVQQLDLEAPVPLSGAPFSVVFCYGVLYHLSQPAQALAYLSEYCQDLLLLSSQVIYGDEARLETVDEQQARLGQSYYGRGSRFTRRWLLEQLQRHFPYVYLPVTQPVHPQFPTDWTVQPTSTEIVRAIFVASRQPLHNPLLTETWLARQEQQA